jgi:hypothetical protein
VVRTAIGRIIAKRVNDLPLFLEFCSTHDWLEVAGGVLFAVGATNTGSPGRASSFWLSDGFLNRERSIPFLTLALPPVI